jgi:hypothetical protein
VRDVAGYLRCSPSIALRRVAAVYLRSQQAPIRAPMNPHVVPVAAMPQAQKSRELSSIWDGRNPTQDTSASAVGEMVVSLVIQALICILIVGAVIFFSTRKDEAGNAA